MLWSMLGCWAHRLRPWQQLAMKPDVVMFKMHLRVLQNSVSPVLVQVGDAAQCIKVLRAASPLQHSTCYKGVASSNANIPTVVCTLTCPGGGVILQPALDTLQLPQDLVK